MIAQTSSCHASDLTYLKPPPSSPRSLPPIPCTPLKNIIPSVCPLSRMPKPMFGTVIKPTYFSQQDYNRKRPQPISTWSQLPVYSSRSVRARRHKPNSNNSSGDDSDHIQNIRLGSPKASQVLQADQDTQDEENDDEDDEAEDDEAKFPPQSSSQAISTSSRDGYEGEELSATHPCKRKRVTSPTPSIPSVISISDESELEEPIAPEVNSPEPEYHDEIVHENVFSMKLRKRNRGEMKQTSLQELRQARELHNNSSQCLQSKRSSERTARPLLSDVYVEDIDQCAHHLRWIMKASFRISVTRRKRS